MSPKNTLAPQLQEAGETIKLEVVLKCDVSGTEEVISEGLTALQIPGVMIEVIQSGVGNVSKSDILMALTGSRLVIGFNVEITPGLEPVIKEQGVEVRLYDTIYKLMEDVKLIAGSLFAPEPEEKITGKAEVIATFKGNRKDAVIGCEVLEGVIEMGRKFRIIAAMGPVYSGKITSLQIERRDVKIGKAGQQVGIQLRNWNQAKIGDLVECYTTVQSADSGPWKPQPGVFRFRS